MRNLRSGQALLLIVLLISLVVTVVIALSYRLTGETQISKTQEESVKALAAADSGADVGMQIASNPGTPAYQTYKQAGIQIQGIDEQRSHISVTTIATSEFASPEVPKDEQYVFYLNNYPDFNNPYTGNLRLYFGSDGAGSCSGSRSAPAVELTILYGAQGDSIQKYLLEPCTSGTMVGGSVGNGKITPTNASKTIDGVNFRYHIESAPINIGSYSQAKIMIARVLFAKSRIGFSTGSTTNLPSQGKTIKSEAIANSGVSSIVSVFQSLPQIPADFFITTF